MRLRLATSATGVALAAVAFGAAAAAQPVAAAPPALEACRLQPTAPLGPGGLRDCFYQAAFRASRAAGHLISFETRTDANAETVASFDAAAAVTSEVLANIAGRPGGKAALARIADVAIARADEPSASLSGGVLTIAIIPARGAAGRPSPGQIETAVHAPVTCITSSRVIEGTTSEACAVVVKAEHDALVARGLAHEARLLAVRANGQILRGTTAVTLTGGQGLATVTDGTLTCRGEYDGNAPWTTTDILFRCTDGRTGIAKRTSSFLNQGEGTIQMSDGEVARFAFGCSTRIGDVRTCPVVEAAQSSIATESPAKSR